MSEATAGFSLAELDAARETARESWQSASGEDRDACMYAYMNAARAVYRAGAALKEDEK